MTIARTIQSLLYTHDCVIIPGLGGILKSYNGATVHPTKHLFSPPSCTLRFNVNLKNDDGLLIHHYATQQDISYKKASKKIHAWSDQIQNRLTNNESVRIVGVGKFYLDLENNLQFIPRNKNQFHLPSFGLPEFQFFPVAPDAEKLDAERKEKLRSSTRSNVALVVLPLLLFGLITHFALDFNNNPLNKMATADLMSSLFSSSTAQLVEHEITAIPEITEEELVTPSEIRQLVKEEELNEEVVAEASDDFRFSIILGAFKSEANAKKQQAKLIQLHQIQTNIIPAKPIYYKVAVPVSDSKRDAFRQLKSFKQINQDAWVYERK